VDIAITSENHIGRGGMNLGSSRFAGLAAGLCAISLLLGLGLRASLAEDLGTSTKYETGSAPASTAPAGKSKYSRSASLATSARTEAEGSNGLPPVAAPDNPKYGGR
jgi:hypothetical protein